MAGGTVTMQDFGPIFVGFSRVFTEAQKNIPTSEWMDIYNIESSDKMYETYLGLVGMGLPSRKAELERPRVDSPMMSYAVKFIHNTFALVTRMSKLAKMYDKSGQVARQLMPEVVRNFKILSEYQHAAIFNLGFTAQGYEPDGVSFFNTAHPLINGQAGGGPNTLLTSSNRSATDQALAVGSLFNMTTIMQRTLTESGKLDPRIPSRLVTGPGQQQLVSELLDSQLKPGQFPGGTQPNDININYKALTPKIWHYLDEITLPSAFYVGQSKEDTKLIHFDAEKLNDDMDYDKLARVFYWAAFAQWSYGFTDWRGWTGSRGA